MKKQLFLFLFIVTAAVFQFCSSSKKVQAAPKVTYAANVQNIITANCSPCHIPPKGNKLPLNTYEAAKNNIDDIIARIQKNPDEKGFMPFKHAKLPDSTIQVFVRWKADGLPAN
jgi:hypothetical protein